MKVAGVVAISNFPMFDETLCQLMQLCDGIVLRYDAKNGDPAVLQSARKICKDKLIKTLICDGWPHPQWREEGLRELDKFSPDIVLCPDEDELFGDGIKEELDTFWHSNKKGMMFSYLPLMAKENRVINGGMPYPPEPHMKAYKWQKGLSYFPYHGNAIIAKYCNRDDQWTAHTKIAHYCCWTLTMENTKHWKSNTPDFKAHKAVTLIAFGPSVLGDLTLNGEVWSLNNCYNLLPNSVMSRCTRIFDMHKFGERTGGRWDQAAKFLGLDQMSRYDRRKGDDGRFHVDHLNELGLAGRRIIMQEKNPAIANSERYPIETVVKTTGVDWFMGSPCYMMAMAILEGYTHITLYGLDQMDWEHILQRECFVGWCMYAAGRGIALDGVLSWLKDIDRRYGYDFGPEFDEWCEEQLWKGHPMQVHYKIPSRVVDGKACEKIGG